MSHSKSLPLPTIDEDVSNRIRVCRVLCIACVVFVHVPPGPHAIEGATHLTHLVRYVLLNFLGQMSVTTLSVVGGYLFVRAASKRGYLGYAAERFRTLYVPMVVWNLALAFVALAVMAVDLHSSVASLLLDKPLWNSLFALWNVPLNEPLYFLRDFLVLALLSPLILAMTRISPLIFLAIGFAIAQLESAAPVFLNPIIPFFFGVGVALYVWRARLAYPRRVELLVAGAVLVFWILDIAAVFNLDLLQLDMNRKGLYDLVSRLAGAALVWVVAGAIARSAAFGLFRRLEKKVNLLFMSHFITVTVLGGIYAKLMGDFTSEWYLLLTIAAPVICILVVELLWPALALLPETAQRVIAGRGIPPRGAVSTPAGAGLRATAEADAKA